MKTNLRNVRSFGPTVRANGARTHVVQSHVVLGPALALRLKRTLSIGYSWEPFKIGLSPQSKVATIKVGFKLQSNEFDNSSRLSAHLEKDRLSVLALGARVILRPRQRGVSDDVGDDVGDLVDLVHDLVHVDAVVVRDLLVVAVAARVEQHPVLLVLLRVQHVVALLKCTNTILSR